ncbi:MAG: hypothetical protein ACE5HC_17170 [Candidatus Binatia bacterium]
MKEKLSWLISGAVFFFLLVWFFGGLYTITPPSGPVDVAYKINRLTGKVWMIKTYAKQVGQVRVLTAREAKVEKTKPVTESDILPIPTQRAPSGRRRR